MLQMVARDSFIFVSLAIILLHFVLSMVFFIFFIFVRSAVFSCLVPLGQPVKIFFSEPPVLSLSFAV